MRIETQSKYLETIMQKAQDFLVFDINNNENLEAVRTQLKNFNLTLSEFMLHVSQPYNSKAVELMRKSYFDNFNKSQNSAFQPFQNCAIMKIHHTE